MERVNKVTLFFANRGRGKTTLVKALIDAYKKYKTFPKYLIVDTFDNPVWRHLPVITIEKLPFWKKGEYRIFGSDTFQIMEAIEQHCYNTVIVFEDAHKFIGKELQKAERRFILDSKQKNLDLYFLFHSVMDAPRELKRIVDYITLFSTGDTKDCCKTVSSNYFKDFFERVNIRANDTKNCWVSNIIDDNRFYNETLRIN